jgi:hypothetical protein
MKRPSTPIAIVGSPIPVMPLTIPATKKVAAIAIVAVGDASIPA